MDAARKAMNSATRRLTHRGTCVREGVERGDADKAPASLGGAPARLFENVGPERPTMENSDL